jgi:drug/metabolite transporter (DMT)-like permease
LLAALVLIWGANWPVLKVALPHIPPIWFAALRLFLAAICLLPVVVLTTRRCRLPSRADLPIVLSIGWFQMAGFLVLINLGLEHVSAGRSAILAYTTPLWTVPGAVLLLGLAGVALMFNPASFDWSDRGVIIGNGALLLAALVWAATILHVRHHRWRMSPFELAPWQLLVGLPPTMLIAWLTEGAPVVDWSPDFILALCYNGPLAGGFGFWAALSVQKRLPAITTSLSFLAVPAWGLLCAAVFLGEPLSPADIGGLGLIVGGLVAVSLADRPGAKPASPLIASDIVATGGTGVGAGPVSPADNAAAGRSRPDR